MSDIYDLIIVGGGPGGIASAVEAYILKINKVLLIEKGKNHSQTIRMYYKDSKRVDKIYRKQEVELIGNVDFFDGTKESTLDHFDSLLEKGLIDTQYNSEVYSATKEDNIFKVVSSNGDFYGKNVIVSIGRMGRPNKPPYDLPRSLRKIINHNTYDCAGGENILVVGGGDSAVEYACQLTTTNKITLSHLGADIVDANDINLEMITRYEKENRLMVLHDSTTIGVEDVDGKPLVKFADGTALTYDRVIFAIGGTTPIGFMQSSNIDMDELDRPIFDDNYETSVDGLYLAGDIIYNKGGSIAMAINHAYTIINDIKKKESAN